MSEIKITFKKAEQYNLWKSILSCSKYRTCGVAYNKNGYLYVTDGMRILGFYSGDFIPDLKCNTSYKMIGAKNKVITLEVAMDAALLNLESLMQNNAFKPLTREFLINSWHDLEMNFAIYNYTKDSANDWNGKRHQFATLNHDYLMDAAYAKLFTVMDTAEIFKNGLRIKSSGTELEIQGKKIFGTAEYLLMGLMTNELLIKER